MDHSQQHSDFLKGKELQSRILIEKWSGDLHMDVQGTNEDQIKSLCAYILQHPAGVTNVIAAMELSKTLLDDKEFMKNMKQGIVRKEIRVVPKSK